MSMTAGSPRRRAIFYAALMAIAFAITLLLGNGGALPWRRDPTAAAGGTGNSAPAGAHAANGTMSGGWPAGDGQSAPGADELAEQRQRLADAVVEASTMAVSGADKEQRGAALARLAAMAGGADAVARPEFIEALELVATRDQEWLMRVRAILALKRAAQVMTDRSRVAAILERATADPNNAVATHARNALASLDAASTDAQQMPGS